MTPFPYDQVRVRKVLLRMLIQALAEVAKDEARNGNEGNVEQQVSLLQQVLNEQDSVKNATVIER